MSRTARESVHKRTTAGAGCSDDRCPEARRVPDSAAERTPTSSSSAPGRPASATAYHLAQAGLDVLLLEKTAFPREKVCGDGLTPRAVQAAGRAWASTSRPRPAGSTTRACASSAAATASRCPGPTSPSYPSYGLVRAAHRLRRDCSPAHAAEGRRPAARAHRRHRPGRSTSAPAASLGVTARATDDDGASGPETTYRAPLVVAADGNSSPALARGRACSTRDDRPMGVAVRTYYTSPRHDDDWLESWLELWDDSGDAAAAAARLRLDLRRRRRHVQRRARHPQHQQGVPERRLQGPAQAAGSTTRPRSGATATENMTQPDPRRGPADGLQPPAALRATGCCWSATPAAWSTRSTARASPTPWSPASSPPRSIAQALARPDAPAGERALAAYPTALKDDLRRLLHARPALREGDRQPRRDAAGHPARAAAPDPDAVHPQAARQPHRRRAAATRWTGSSTPSARLGAGGMSTARRRRDVLGWRDRPASTGPHDDREEARP